VAAFYLLEILDVDACRDGVACRERKRNAG
jgi:hypothetical protein